ncbi:MAG: glycosyl transferase [Clostridia bacterium]|nr:glycosyl transferase [Clostridia bacterium]
MIPKIIHYCWVGGAPLPESAKKCIKSWRKYCPDYEIIEWNESNYDFTSVDYMKEAYEAKKWGFVPDYARLDIVYTHGGIYLDTDVEIVKSFDPLLSLSAFAGFQEGGEVALGLGFGAEAGSPVIKKLMDSYAGRHFISAGGEPDLTPSPRLNTATLVKEYGLRLDGTFQELDGITVFPADYFCPKSFEDGIVRKTKNTYSIHHFDASWYTEKQNIEKQQRWEYLQAQEERERRRERKLRNRRIFGGFFRKIFGDKGWEKLKRFLFGRR